MYRPISLADFGKALTDIGHALSLVQILATGRVPVVRAILDSKLGVPPLEWWPLADISDVPRSAVTFRLRDGRVIRATAIDLDLEAADLLLRPPPPISEERFDRPTFEERVRRSAGQGAHVPESRPVPQWPIGAIHIKVKEAARLLEIGCPAAPLAKPDDSDVRSDVIKSVRYHDMLESILRHAREGGAHLIHPTLGIPVPDSTDPDENWFIGQEAFENVRTKLLGRSADVLQDNLPGVDGAELKTRVRKGGRNPGDGAKNDEAELSIMLRLIAESKVTSPHAAALKMIEESRARGENPAQNAHRRLAKKFLAKHRSQRRDGETWGDFCRRIEGELQPNRSE
jgi:hypothetical protein